MLCYDHVTEEEEEEETDHRVTKWRGRLRPSGDCTGAAVGRPPSRAVSRLLRKNNNVKNAFTLN